MSALETARQQSALMDELLLEAYQGVDVKGPEQPSLGDVSWIPYIAVERFDVVAVGIE